MHNTSDVSHTEVAIHDLRDRAKEAVAVLQVRNLPDNYKDNWNNTHLEVPTRRRRNFFTHPDDVECEHIPQVYGYIFRTKSTWELLILAGSICGIEFCYAAETAFVTPIVLSLGLNIKFVTMIWCLSPLIGFFLSPILGSFSDSCESKYGRRRPFILLLSAGIILGLILVPNGNRIGIALGDTPNLQAPLKSAQIFNDSQIYENETMVNIGTHLQPWSIAFTVLGTALLDFCSDACQSPSRTYLLDVCIPEDHTAGLSTFALMAGFGGAIGFLVGAVHWEETAFGIFLGGQVNVVFTIVGVVFVICLIFTLRSFPEIPLNTLRDPKVFNEYQKRLQLGEFREKGNELKVTESTGANHGIATITVAEDSTSNGILNGISFPSEAARGEKESNSGEQTIPVPPILAAKKNEHPTLKEYLKSIIQMPKSVRIVCLTNFFCWMSLVCYTLYFTDFVGEVVYGGDPQAPEGSEELKLFNDGVSFACWGMALYSISCSFYSYFIEAMVKRLGAKPVYIGGQLVYSVGMIIMAATRHPVAIILMSPTAGVMYSTLFTMPYLLIAHYHSKQTFKTNKSGREIGARGIGTDVALVSSMVFLSQFTLSMTMGSIVEAVGSKVAIVVASAILSACGAITATQVMYLDM